MSHFVHVDEPESVEFVEVPMGQSRQPRAPKAEYLPAAQRRHAVAPVIAPYAPPPHCTQDDPSVVAMKRPALHNEHVDEAKTEYCPAVQLVQ